MLASSQRSWLQQSSTTCLIPGLMTGCTSTPWPHNSRIWSHTNAHTDLWLSVLSSLQLDPVACLSGTINMDFLDDQWSHFSPSPDDLYAIYGLEIQKIHLWRPLRDHLHEQLGAGRMLIVEVAKSWLQGANLIVENYYPSSWHLPIAVNAIDETQHSFGYFFGQNYLQLEGEAYRRFINELSDFLPGAPNSPWIQAHVLSVHGWVRPPQHALEKQSWRALEHVLGKIPACSPVDRWQQRYAQDAARYAQADPALFKAWSAKNVQSFGAAFELASWYLLWAAKIGRGGAQHLVQAADTFRQLSVLAKALQLKSERSYQMGQAYDATDLLERIARYWHKGMNLLHRALPLQNLNPMPQQTQ